MKPLTEIAHGLAGSYASAERRAQFLRDGKKIALYGAGGTGRDLLPALTEAGFHVSCYLDQKASPGQAISGIPVCCPSDPALASEIAKTHVIVSIFNHFSDVAAVVQQLRNAGWFSVTSIVELYQLIPGLDNRYWLTSNEFYADKAEPILSLQNLWADEKSRRLYESFLEFRLTGDYTLLPSPEPHQYFPKDVPAWPEPLRLIDCGAYNGDTLRTIEELNLPVASVAAFEPDLSNFAELVAQRNGDYFKQEDVTLWPCGVYGRTEQLRFSSGLGAASTISEGGTQVIQCVALDDCLSTFAPTLLKMDIEGAEYDALQGARQLIRQHRPGLAICVYHHPDDLWRIPLLIRDWDLGYRFYLRTHAFSGFDLVLYAVAQEPDAE